MTRTLNLILILLSIAPAFAQKKPVTLESLNRTGGRGRGDAAGAPLWAPDGRSFAYRQGHKIVLYDATSKTAKELVDTTAMDAAAVKTADDDGPVDWQNRRVRQAPLQWSPTGKELLYVAGGDLFLIHVDGGKWDQITKTREIEADPKLSPDGKAVGFRRGWDLYTLDLATGKETRLTHHGTESLRNGGLDWVYPEEIGLSTAWWWSPDSKSVAFLQFDTNREPLFPHEDLLRTRAVWEPQRYPQAGENNADVRLGMVGATGGATKWLDVGDTRNSYLIARAGWMPDSKSVYVLRTNRIQNRSELFSILIESGAPSTIFRESDPYWINLKDDVDFLKDGKRFLWTSERGDGFRHIYLYSNDGKDVKQLTKGSWEVSAVNAVDEAGGRVFYTSTEPSSLERHLYSIGLTGGDKRRLTSTAGTHNISMGPGGAYYLDTYSNLTSPPRTTLHSGDGKELGVYKEADRGQIDEFEILPTEIVEFKAADGTVLHGRLIKPAGFQPGKKYPVIVAVYGGPGVALPVRNSWPGGANVDQAYAHHGYVVWQAENRGGSGRGHAFETAIYRNLGAAELADQVAGVKHLVSLGFADPERVGIHGGSYGGYMTLNAMLNAPGVFRCGIASSAVTSWLDYDTIYTERYMGLPKDNVDGYKDTALPQRAKNLQGKLLILHNFEDDNVLFQNALQMTDALQLAGKQFEFMLYPQKNHGITGAAARQMNVMMLDFFDRNLK